MELYESVPNVSCGQNREFLGILGSTLNSVAGCRLIHIDIGYDADRTVFTLVGHPDALLEATVLLYRQAALFIDMRNYRGNHPAIGAVDVCPFVPISEGATIEICKDLACRLAERVVAELAVPVYLYRESAVSAGRVELSAIRRGGLLGLAARIGTEDWVPDYGSRALHPSFGATVIGARPILIAYNVNLETSDIAVAKRIAAQIRESSASMYSLKACRALGWFLATKQIAQVSTNLYDYHVTGMQHVFESVKRLAAQEGIGISGSEVVGLLPEQALVEAAMYFNNSFASRSELCLRAVENLRLSDLSPFVISERVIDVLCRDGSN